MVVESPLVSVLFVTYKRFDNLERAIESFRRNTDYPNLEIVIADDGSGAEIQEKIRQIPANGYALSEKNRGLGANNNAGLSHCHGKYVLMIQDDWECHGPPDYLSQSVAVMEANPDVGLINFAGSLNSHDPSLRLVGSEEPCFLTPDPANDKGVESFLYSDQPHLQSMAALRFIGPYQEEPMVRSEIHYCRSWKNQNRFRTAVFPAWHLTVFRCDYQAPSFSAAMFSRRTLVALLPFAQWLKRHCHPAYRAGRAGFNACMKILESLRLVH